MQNPFNPIQQLLALHAREQFREMEQQARQLLQGHGNVAIVNELLGIALSAQKKFPEALPYLQKAVRKMNAIHCSGRISVFVSENCATSTARKRVFGKR